MNIFNYLEKMEIFYKAVQTLKSTSRVQTSSKSGMYAENILDLSRNVAVCQFVIAVLRITKNRLGFFSIQIMIRIFTKIKLFLPHVRPYADKQNHKDVFISFEGNATTDKQIGILN